MEPSTEQAADEQILSYMRDGKTVTVIRESGPGVVEHSDEAAAIAHEESLQALIEQAEKPASKKRK